MAKKPQTAAAAGEQHPSEPAPAPEPAPASPPAPPASVDVPVRIKMTAPHGFIDEETGAHRYWQQGQEVFDPADVAILIERGARFEPVE